MIDCDLCHTEGEIPFEWVAVRMPGDPEYFCCPRCKGEGSIRNPKFPPEKQ